MEGSLRFLPRAVRKKQTVNQASSTSDEQNNTPNEEKPVDGNFEYKAEIGKPREKLVIVSLNEVNNSLQTDGDPQRKVFIKTSQEPSGFNSSSTQQYSNINTVNESNTTSMTNYSIPTVLTAIENQTNPPYRDIGCLSRKKHIAVYKRPRIGQGYYRNECYKSEHAVHFSNVSWRPQFYNSLEYSPLAFDVEYKDKRDLSWSSGQHYYRFERDRYFQNYQKWSYESYQSHNAFFHRHFNKDSQFYANGQNYYMSQNSWPFCYPREWEYTEFGQIYLRQTPVAGQLDFTVMSYNVLAQDLLEDNRYLYPHCLPYILEWEYRRRCLLEEFKAHRPDILCLQEVNAVHFEDFFKPELEKMGYKGEYVKRTGSYMDGCATFYKTTLFSLEEAIPIHYKHPDGGEVLDRDNVALILKLVPNLKGQGQDHSGNSKTLCISNTHLLFNPRRGDVKLAQLMVLLAELDKCGYLNNGNDQDSYHGLIMCGDFNLEPNSDIYQLLAMGRLEYEGLPRKSLSGQEVDYTWSVGPKLKKNFLPSSVGINDRCQYCNTLNERKKNILNLGQVDDIIMATQGSGCLTHQLKLLSAYTHQISRFRYEVDEVTTHHGRASCTVDYIFYGIDSAETTFMNDRVCVSNVQESKLKLVGRYGLLSDRELEDMGSLPNDRLGSDHLCLIARFVLS